MPLLAFPLFFLLFLNLFSIDVIKVGIVDFERILIEILNPQLKEKLDQIKSQYQEKIDELNIELSELRRMYDEAVMIKDSNSARSFANQYNLKIDDLKKITSLSKTNLEQHKAMNMKNLNNNSESLNKILDGIQYIAETNGFSLIIKKDNPYILYHNSTVDITDDVIKHLLARKKLN